MNNIIDIIYNEYSIEKSSQRREDIIKKENELLKTLTKQQRELYYSIILGLTQRRVEDDKNVIDFVLKFLNLMKKY